MDKTDSNFENGKTTYFEQDGQFLDIDSFFEDTFGDLPPEEYKLAMEKLQTDTEEIEMGSTTKSNLARITTYLESMEIQTEDVSQAKDISIVRVLKLLPGINMLRESEREEYVKDLFFRTVLSYTLDDLKDFSRKPVTVKTEDGEYTTTYDQHMRNTGAALNIQRHVDKEEMGVVLYYVKELFTKYYLENR